MKGLLLHTPSQQVAGVRQAGGERDLDPSFLARKPMASGERESEEGGRETSSLAGGRSKAPTANVENRERDMHFRYPYPC
jgi:hypothetical protein